MNHAVPPSPLDGKVHLLTDVTAERGTRTITVRCGAKMPKYRTWERLAGASGFASRVTCSGCKSPSSSG